MQILTENPNDPAHYRYVITPTGSGWVRLTVTEVAERAAESQAFEEARPLAKIAGIKAEAARRINLYFPEWKQRNLTARGVELQDNWRMNGAWTAEEEAEAAAIREVWAWIKAVRARSDALEQTLPDDFTDDRHWE